MYYTWTEFKNLKKYENLNMTQKWLLYNDIINESMIFNISNSNNIVGGGKNKVISEERVVRMYNPVIKIIIT